MDSLCTFCEIKDTHIREIPGEPLIPYKTASILLPQGAAVKTVKVKHKNPLVEKGIDIPWGQPPCTVSGTSSTAEKNQKIYNSDNAYPGKLFEVVTVHSFKGFDILYVNLFPVQYNPKSGTVKFYETLTVTVTYDHGKKNPLYRGLKGDKKEAALLVDNPEVITTYQEADILPFATEEYIIITSEALESSFLRLANHKSGYVDGTEIYTVAWILTNYAGDDNAEKVRNFIKDKYEHNGLQWCLLGGDVSVVPYRGLYVSANGYTDNDMAADMYFGCLDGDFDADGDGIYGEPIDDVDWLEEVFIGRAPVETTTEAAAFVDKVITYEHSEKPERVQFHQARLRPGNNHDSRCLAWNCDNYVPPGWAMSYLFEEDSTVSKADWENAWAENPLIVQHAGHGNTALYEINYENGGNVTWANADVSRLTNTFFPWATSIACLSGEFTANDCLAETYVNDDCGAIAAYYNDNSGWFSTLNACKYSGEFVEMQFKALFTDGKEQFGELLNQSKAIWWVQHKRMLPTDGVTTRLT
jgi:hypothetical protein